MAAVGGQFTEFYGLFLFVQWVYTAPTLAATAVPKSKKFMRDVVLLSCDDPDTLPRGARKMVLQEEGRVANMVQLG